MDWGSVFRPSAVYTPRLEGNSWVARDVIISKEPPKLLSLSGTRGGKLISVNNFSAEERASSENNYSHGGA